MSELDCLVAKSLESIIEDNLSSQTLSRIQNRLTERHGMSLKQAIENFSVLDSVLREFFGGGAEGLERKFIKSVITLEKSIEAEREMVTVEDKELSSRILRSLGDNEKCAILDSVKSEARTVREIIELCNISQNVGYLKISALIEDGLLTADNNTDTTDAASKKYKALFENINVMFDKNEISVKIQMSEQHLRNSAVVQVIRERR